MIRFERNGAACMKVAAGIRVVRRSAAAVASAKCGSRWSGHQCARERQGKSRKRLERRSKVHPRNEPPEPGGEWQRALHLLMESWSNGLQAGQVMKGRASPVSAVRLEVNTVVLNAAVSACATAATRHHSCPAGRVLKNQGEKRGQWQMALQVRLGRRMDISARHF